MERGGRAAVSVGSSQPSQGAVETGVMSMLARAQPEARSGRGSETWGPRRLAHLDNFLATRASV